MKIGELFAEIGFKTDTAGLEKASTELKGFQTKTLGAIAGVTAFIAAMANLQDMVRGGSAELKAFANQTGLSVEKLQLLQNEAKSLDINADPTAIENSVRAIQDNLGDIAIGRGDISIFQRLGIDPRNTDAFDVIDQFQAKIPRLKAQFGQNQVVNFGQQLGLDASLVTALQKSTAESRAFAQSLVRTGKNTETLNNLSRSIGDMNASFGLLKDMLVEAIAPAIEVLVKAIKAVVKPLINILSVFNEMDPIIGAIATSLTLAFGAGALASLLGFSGGLRKVMLGLTSIKLLATSLSVVFKRLMVVMFKFILPFLILEDLFVFFQGGKSLFGDMVEGLQNVDFSALFDSLKQGFFDIFREIGRFLLEDVFDPIFEKVGINLVTTSSELAEEIAEKTAKLQGIREGKETFIFGSRQGAIKELELELAELRQQQINNMSPALNRATQNPVTLPSSITNNSRNQKIEIKNDIHVEGASNAINAHSMGQVLQRQYQQASQQLANGGDR
jgi:hypothetical protein